MASVCRDELEAVMVSIGSFLPNFMLSGKGSYSILAGSIPGCI